ncbi:family 20 glycosylhydrolase [Dactylosporangium sp. NPDC006015]|uniref:family 20 glycosylhydrolase n=1 Tax=Dactylosporangium sp. NPDC006015 TaxID=3154576 RepID=UPI0033B944E3
MMFAPPRHGTPPDRRSRRRLAGIGAAAVLLAALGPLTPSVAEAATTQAFSTVVPRPATVTANPAVSYTVTASTRIYTWAGNAAAGAVGTYLAGILRPSTGFPLTVTTTSDANQSGGIALVLSGAPASVGANGYQLDVTAGGVVIRAQQPAGLFAGVQSLRQIMPPQIEARAVQAGPWVIPGGQMIDQPRYAYRAAMLDVARHFFTVDQVKRYIDQLALYKMNHLHLHLTDDQGWRIEITGYPNLTGTGAGTSAGGWSGGYYTQAQFRDLVAYANSRYVAIVPEIDMPGHTNAALASHAPLNCDGVAPAPYTGTAVGFSSLCLTDPDTRPFVDEVIRQLAGMTTGPFLHIGGDEAHSTPHEQFLEFVTWAQQTVVKYGKTPVGWNEISASTLQPGAVLQYWNTPTSNASVAAAAAAGHGIIMSPANRAYIDLKHTATNVIGLTWAGITNVQRAYDWNPGATLENVPDSAIRGVEAALWTESVTSQQDVDYLAFPRLPALAELGWSPWSTHDWASFRTRLAAQGPRWDQMGIRYHHSTEIPWPVPSSAGPAGTILSGVPGNKCVDVEAGRSADGTAIILYDCHGGAPQQLTLHDDGTIRAFGKCVDIADGGTADGARLVLWTCHGGGNQQWRWDAAGGASVRNPASGKCLDDPGASTANLTRLQIWTCNGGIAQRWKLP